MTKPIPPIRKYMTLHPHTVGRDQSLSQAHHVMRTHGVRHLPVLDGGQLAGVVSQRDLHLIETLRDVDPQNVLVEEAMSNEVFSVSPDAPLDEVVDAMAEHKYGCAVVMQNRHVVGVFTTVDACSALSELLRGRLAK